MGVPDDRGCHGRVLDPELTDAIHPSHQGLGDLGAQYLTLTHQLPKFRPLEPEQAARLGRVRSYTFAVRILSRSAAISSRFGP